MACRLLERVDHFDRGKCLAETLKFTAEKAQVKRGVMPDEDGSFQPHRYLAGDFSEAGRPGQFGIRQPVDMRCAGRERPGRVDQRLEGVEHFIAPAAQDGDFTDTVAKPGGKPGGFGIQEGERAGSKGGHEMYLIAFCEGAQMAYPEPQMLYRKGIIN